MHNVDANFDFREFEFISLKSFEVFNIIIYNALVCCIDGTTEHIIEPVHEISNNVVCVTTKDSDQPAQTRSLIRAFASLLRILLLLSY